jgi:hypothetical protein
MQDNASLSYVWGNKNSECDFSKELFYSGFSNRLLVSGDGTIYPMIGFYKKIGHIDTDKLEDVFYNNELLKQARKITIDDIPECKNCSEKCSEENLKKIHSHTLKPNKGHFWACDLCRSHVYKNGISLRCIPCDFDICVYCFWNIPNPNTNNNNNDSNRVY